VGVLCVNRMDGLVSHWLTTLLQAATSCNTEWKSDCSQMDSASSEVHPHLAR
jgi:hypothetical protein